MAPKSLPLVLAAALALAPMVSVAKVSHAVVLCLETEGYWLTPKIEAKLVLFATEVTETSRTHGEPEVVISSSVFLPRGQSKGSTAPDREQSVIHRVRALGVNFGAHETYRLPIDAKPQDFGCSATQAAVELEALFKHPISK